MKFTEHTTMRETHRNDLEKWFLQVKTQTGNTGEIIDYNPVITQFSFEYDCYGKIEVNFEYSLETYTVQFTDEYQTMRIIRHAHKHEPITTYAILMYSDDENEDIFEWFFKLLDCFEFYIGNKRDVVFKIVG